MCSILRHHFAWTIRALHAVSSLMRPASALLLETITAKFAWSMDNTASTLTRLHAARLLIISVRQPDTRGLEAPARAIRIISAWTRNSDHGDEDGKLKNYNIVRNILRITVWSKTLNNYHAIPLLWHCILFLKIRRNTLQLASGR